MMGIGIIKSNFHTQSRSATPSYQPPHVITPPAVKPYDLISNTPFLLHILKSGEMEHFAYFHASEILMSFG